MDKKRLLSIGKLSKLTGVHIQSLRYYEKLGILKPVYTDPETNYRYYTFQQISIVEAIQYCADLDIPLKQFRDFLIEKDGQINYAKLIEQGTRLTVQKMQKIQTRLNFLENMQQEIAHAQDCYENQLVKSFLPEKIYWAIPYDATQSQASFHRAVYRLISDLEKNGLKAGYDVGQLLIYKGNKVKSYIFIDIRDNGQPLDNFPHIIHIPKGEYLCKVSQERQIQKAPEIFPELFAQAYDKIVVEVELFTEKFNYSAPIYEIRCTLPCA